MLDFKIVKIGLEDHFKKMSEENEHLFVVDVDKDEMWNLYLDSIPPEDNKIFRQRREYDCSCCRHLNQSGTW